MDLLTIKQQMAGRWQLLLGHLGVVLPKANKHGECPACGGKDRFRFDDIDGNGTWYCNQCDPHAGDGFALLQNALNISFAEALKLADEHLGNHQYQAPFVVNSSQQIQDKYLAAKAQAKALWEKSAEPSNEQPYLAKKKIGGAGARVLTGDYQNGHTTFKVGDLIVPVYKEGELSTLEFVGERYKQALKGGQKSSGYFPIGEQGYQPANYQGDIWLAEGYATGCSIHEAVNCPVYVCFSANNLKPVSQFVSQMYPNANVVIGADDDLSLAGQKAAESTGLPYALPPFSEAEKGVLMPNGKRKHTDWNDYMLLGHDIKQALENAEFVQVKLVDTSKDSRSPIGAVFELRPGFDDFDTQFSYLIKGYLPANALGMVFGASGSFKSFHVLSWAVHIALGRPWNGCMVNQAPILYIAGEGGLGVPRRIRALALRYNDGQQIPDFFRLDFGVAIHEVDQVGVLLRTIQEKERALGGRKFGLVIIDTLARCFGSRDENSTEHMNTFINACDRIRKVTGATVLVVHHSGAKDKERARGSTAMRAACDFEYRIERHHGEGTALILESTKAKDDKQHEGQLFELQSYELFIDDDGDPVVSLACDNEGKEPPEEVDKEAPQLTSMEQTVYQAVRSRLAAGESTALAIVRDDLKAQGTNTRRFSAVVEACIKKQVLRNEDGTLKPVVVEESAA